VADEASNLIWCKENRLNPVAGGYSIIVVNFDRRSVLGYKRVASNAGEQLDGKRATSC